MPGANCAVFGCGTCRNEKDVGIFTLSNPNKDDFYRKWNRDMLNIITKDRIITPGFKSRIEKNNVFKCEKHFDSDQIYFCEYYYLVILSRHFRILICSYLCKIIIVGPIHTKYVSLSRHVCKMGTLMLFFPKICYILFKFMNIYFLLNVFYVLAHIQQK